MASIVEIARKLLIDAEVVIMPGIEQLPGDGTTQCYVRSLADEVDQAACIYSMAGLSFGRRMQDPKRLIHHGLMVKVRHLDDKEGEELINSIANAFGEVLGVEVVLEDEKTHDLTTHYVHSVYQVGTILPLGEEVGKRRFQYTMNARLVFQDREPQVG